MQKSLKKDRSTDAEAVIPFIFVEIVAEQANVYTKHGCADPLKPLTLFKANRFHTNLSDSQRNNVNKVLLWLFVYACVHVNVCMHACVRVCVRVCVCVISY